MKFVLKFNKAIIFFPKPIFSHNRQKNLANKWKQERNSAAPVKRRKSLL
jgi:hypothetical protein